MEKTKKNLINIFYIAFGIVFAYIILNILFNNNINLFKNNSIIVILGAVLYLSIFVCIYKYVFQNNKFNEKIFLIVVFGFMSIIQFTFGYLFRVTPSWDFGCVIDSAIKSATGVSALSNIDYFYMYNNNFGIAMFFKIIFKFFSFFGINNYNAIGISINIIFINIAIFFTYLIFKNIFGIKKSIVGLLMFSIFTPFYTYVPIFYTDTITLPFIIVPLYLYLKAEKQNSNKKKILLYITTSFVIFIGMLLKFTVVIIPIAIFGTTVLYKTFKENIKVLVAFIIPIIILFSLQKVCINYFFDEERLDKIQYPFTHWIMMGLSGNSGYNEEDFQYTLKFESKSEKQKANLIQIKDRISNHIKNGTFLEFFTKKLVYVWGDGTYYSPEKLRRKPIEIGSYHEFILTTGKYSYIYGYLAQIQHVSMLILIFVSLFNYKLWPDKEKSNFKFLLNLSLVGIMLFLLLWEARSRYLVNFLPVMMLLSMYGLDTVVEYINKYKYKRIE